MPSLTQRRNRQPPGYRPIADETTKSTARSYTIGPALISESIVSVDCSQLRKTSTGLKSPFRILLDSHWNQFSITAA